jgi:beta-galactosidase
METKWVTFTDNYGVGIMARRSRVGSGDEQNGELDARFSRAPSRYSTETVERADHPRDLMEEDCTFIRLDDRVAGVGTGACGPEVRDEHRVHVEPMDFAFRLDRLSQ